MMFRSPLKRPLQDVEMTMTDSSGSEPDLKRSRLTGPSLKRQRDSEEALGVDEGHPPLKQLRTFLPLSQSLLQPTQIAVIHADDFSQAKEFINCVNLNSIGPDGQTSLTRAVISGGAREMRFLLDNGAQLNLPNAEKKMPLWLAIRYGHLEAINVLLDHQALPGDDEILTACEYGLRDLVPRLHQQIERLTGKKITP